ncbi:hypothetical protein [Billgrantia kenyensis]|uniref:Uncharacterized protein n=1 Tax=Billgrantia kenyensis TaxID=321266 RepID=A0A7V9W426_9GAMM|nr:hypothetical protein [Halomonas kenyensis]MBA2780599.1 hypothetical protein [Halomonas kenyensis]MCG6663292.1 hypothetical protein [Halomonas kenyensis]
MSPTRIERVRLYELVWSRPMSHLAKEYGLPSQKLKEVCDKAGIPTPAPGHWQRIAAGKKVSQPPLPDAPPENSLLAIAPYTPRMRAPVPSGNAHGTDQGLELTPAARPKQKKRGVRSGPDLEVPAKLGRAHPIISGWQEEHKRQTEEAKKYRWGGVGFAPAPLTAMDRRRYRILSTLFKAIEKVGGKAIEEERKATAIEIEGEKIPFQLREKQKQVRRPLTESEKRWRSSGDRDWRQELKPTGKLIFEIKSYLPSGFKSQWLETDEISMENLLPEIFDTIQRVAPILANRTKERLEKRRLEEIAAHERYLAEQERKRDNNRWQRFLELADSWQQHEQARHFLAALTQLEIERDTSVGDMTLAEWLTWAEGRLAAGNPLSHGVEALFSDIEKITSYTSFKKPIY